MHVVPRARRTEVAGLHGDAIKIRVAAPPADGAANAALIRFIADRLDVPRHAVAILAGAGSRNKVVTVEGLSADAVRVRLTGEAPS